MVCNTRFTDKGKFFRQNRGRGLLFGRASIYISMKKIHIVFGGASVEHDVSIVTALQAAGALRGKYEVGLVYISKDNRFFLSKKHAPADYIDKDELLKCSTEVHFGKRALYKVGRKKDKFLEPVDVVINCCHGGIGEDGRLAGLMEINEIPVSSCDTRSAEACMDKEITKLLADSIGIPIVEYACLSDFSPESLARAGRLGEHLIVKPCGLGSSIGVMRSNQTDLKNSVEMVLSLDTKALVEREIEPLVEYNCAALRDGDELILSEIEQPINKNEILSFEDKYLNTEKSRILPAQIDENIQQIIYSYTKKIYNYLGLNGVVRVDYLFDGNTIYLNEVNTIPGSLAYYLFEGIGLDYIRLLEILAKNARVKPLQTYFSSNILNNLKEIGK